jgi:hypothetical protein
MERNRYLTLLTFYPVSLIILIGLPGMVMDIGMFFFSLISGWFKDEMKIYKYFFQTKNYLKIRAEKEKIKTYQKIPFKHLAHNFSGRIEFQEIANPLLKYFINPLFDLYWQIVKKII